MANKKGYRVAKEVKAEIVRRVKEEGISVSQAAKDAGVHETTIYGWLGSKVEGIPSILEYAKLKRENDELLRLVGLMTLKLNETQKKK